MIDRGSGQTVVLIPSIQRRWEWMTNAIDALAKKCRVLTDSLQGDKGSNTALDPARGFESYVDWIDSLLRNANADTVSLCGVSFGGWIALHYTATRPNGFQA